MVVGVRPCPNCGTGIPAETWAEGICPQCLLELALEDSSLEARLGVDPQDAPTLRFSAGGFAEGEIQGERYRIRSLLGRGGMGEVWRAYDLKLRQDVALKALRKELTEDRRALEMLRQEVRAAREVISPNVCRVFDLQEVDGRELVSMEYIDGRTLQSILEERSPLALEEAREIASQFLAGLEAIHAAGLIHRDIKPENVMLTRTGRVVVMDFGIAKGLEERTGVIAGTPAYMSPEQQEGRGLDARSDVFSAGVVLAEMVEPGGCRDFESRRRVWEGIHRETPEIAETAWSKVIARAVAAETDGRYDTASALARALEEVTLRAKGDETARPYPGLSAFQQEDARFFFGRELEVEALWKKLRRPHLLAVIGPSGAGKSSFLRAGLLPTLTDGWSAIIVTPGNRPFANLSQALSESLGEAPGVSELVSRIEEPGVAIELMSDWRQAHDRALIIVDQFEELFTQNPEEVQRRFAELLGRLPLEADIYVLLSMRDDFVMQCHRFEALQPIFSELTPLDPPTGASLRRAIVEPALRCGYRFEDEGMVEEMLAEVEGERGALPMVAFTAAQLWERRDREAGYLTRKAYEAIGGVGGALAQHAEAMLDYIGETNVPIVRELFRNLVTAQGTRASRDRDELLSVFGETEGEPFHEPSAITLPPGPAPQRPAARHVLDTLIDARLLTSYEVPDAEGSAHQRLEIVHESLLSHWPRLVRWRLQDAEGAQLRDELRAQAQLWQQHGRSVDYLWTGAAYLDYLVWRERYPGGLTATEEAYAQAMTAHAERRRRQKRLALGAVLAVLLAVLAVVTWSRFEAKAEARRAEAANLYSIAQLKLDGHPSGALAYATRSLELADSASARQFVVRALWKGPTEIRLAQGSFISLDFSPDGRWLATSDRQETCSIWPSDGGAPLRFDGCEQPMEGFFSPAGDQIGYFLGGLTRERLRLWSFPDSRLLRTFDLGGGESLLFRFDPAGRRMVTSTAHPRELGSGYDYEIRSWPLEGGEPDLVARIEISGESTGAYVDIDPTVSRLAWPEGPRLKLAAIEGGTADLASLATLEQERRIVVTAFDGEGRQIATLDENGVPRVWSLASDPPALVRTLPAAQGVGNPAITALRFSASGSMLAYHEGYLWDLRSPPGAALQRLRRTTGAVKGEDQEFGGFCLAFHPHGQWVAIGHPQSVSLWPLARPYPWVLSGHEGWVQDIEFTPDGNWLVSMAGDRSVRLWPLRSADEGQARILHRLDGAYPPARLAMAPNGSFVAVGSYFGQVLILPLDGGPSTTLSHSKDIMRAVAIGPESLRVAAGGGGLDPAGAIVRIWDLETGAVRLLDNWKDKGIRQLWFEDRDRLWVLTGDGTLTRWELESEPPRLLQEHAVSGAVVDLRPDLMQALVREGGSGPLWLYDLASRTSRQLVSHGSTVAGAAFDPSGSIVASTDKQGIVRVGRASGEEPHLLLGHEGEIGPVSFSPDARWIVTGADDKLIVLWPMPDLDKPPLHTLPREELLAKLKTLTNLRAVEDPESPTGWNLEIGPFPGWEEVPTW